MSIVNYNSIQLPYPYTTQFAQEPVYDEESLTDWFVTRYTIRVKCLLNTQYLTITTGGITLQTPAQLMNFLRDMLMKSRKTLSFTVDGIEMIPQPQQAAKGNVLQARFANAGEEFTFAGGKLLNQQQMGDVPGTVDAYNGPKPVHCNIVQLTNNTFDLDYMIVAHYWVNNPGNGTSQSNAGSNVLFNRWSETVELDDLMLSRRIRDGYFRIRSDNIDGVIPDNLRTQMAVLSIPPKFLRVKSRYIQDKDGLTLHYHIEDQEVYKMPPGLATGATSSNPGVQARAFRAEGRYTEVADQFKNAFRLITVWVRLYGSATTSQVQLVATAIQIASVKIQKNKGEPRQGQAVNIFSKGPLITNRKIDIDMYNNIVDVTFEAMANFTSKRLNVLAGLGDEPLTYTPGSDQALANGTAVGTPGYTSRGTAGLLLQAAAYYDPNVLNASLGAGTSNIQAATNDAVIVGQNSVIQMPGAVPGTAGKSAEP